jgi:lipopolysaccharide export system protein LptA
MLRERSILPALVLVAVCGPTLPAWSQGAQPEPPANNQPIEIQADNGIEWQQEAHVYIARGNAVASRGGAEIHADTLIAYYRPSKGSGQAHAKGPAPEPDKTRAPGTGDTDGDGGTEIYRVDAEGNVTIKNPSRTVVGDHAVWDVDQAVGIVTGKTLKMTTATDSVTARDSLEWYDQKQVGVARGDAVATRGTKTIKADVLTIYLEKSDPNAPPDKGTAPAEAKPGDGKGAAQPAAAPAGKPAGAGAKPGGEDSKISRVDAQGHVVVTNPPDTGHGDYGVYNAKTGICTLIGNVVIARDKDVVKGQYAVMDLNQNVDRILPASSLPGHPPERVQGLFVRQEQTPPGAPGAKPAAPAPGGKGP